MAPPSKQSKDRKQAYIKRTGPYTVKISVSTKRPSYMNAIKALEVLKDTDNTHSSPSPSPSPLSNNMLDSELPPMGSEEQFMDMTVFFSQRPSISRLESHEPDEDTLSESESTKPTYPTPQHFHSTVTIPSSLSAFHNPESIIPSKQQHSTPFKSPFSDPVLLTTTHVKSYQKSSSFPESSSSSSNNSILGTFINHDWIPDSDDEQELFQNNAQRGSLFHPDTLLHQVSSSPRQNLQVGVCVGE